MTLRRVATAALATAAASLLAAACSASSATSTATAKTGTVVAVGAENEYANVISQIGGKYVRVTAVESNPNTDPHSFEASASVSEVVGAAELVVQNGIGYDSYMDTHREGLAQLRAQGHQRAAPAAAARLHPEPAPVVLAGHHAGRGQGHRG